MQPIFTKYISPAAIKGSRIKAYCDDGSITIDYPHELSGDAVYRAAADVLCKKLGWAGELIGGRYKNGMVFVFSPNIDT